MAVAAVGIWLGIKSRSPGAIFSKLGSPNAVANSAVCVYSKIPVALARARTGIDRHDAIPSKTARAKLAPARCHARARGLWRRCDLQRDLHARRSGRSRLLAEAGQLD